MRVLLYGFGPYGGFRHNITARMIRAIPAGSRLKTIVFPVRFRRRQFVEALTRHEPDLILGLGQSTRKEVVVETRAGNRRRAREDKKAQPIFANRPMWLPTTLKLSIGRWAGRSRDAGDYVCNYSMYVLLDEIARRRRDVRLGFIHVPYDYDLDKACRLLQRVMRQCQRLS